MSFGTALVGTHLFHKCHVTEFLVAGCPDFGEHGPQEKAFGLEMRRLQQKLKSAEYQVASLVEEHDALKVCPVLPFHCERRFVSHRGTDADGCNMSSTKKELRLYTCHPQPLS